MRKQDTKECAQNTVHAVDQGGGSFIFFLSTVVPQTAYTIWPVNHLSPVFSRTTRQRPFTAIHHILNSPFPPSLPNRRINSTRHKNNAQNQPSIKMTRILPAVHKHNLHRLSTQEIQHQHPSPSRPKEKEFKQARRKAKTNACYQSAKITTTPQNLPQSTANTLRVAEKTRHIRVVRYIQSAMSSGDTSIFGAGGFDIEGGAEGANERETYPHIAGSLSAAPHTDRLCVLKIRVKPPHTEGHDLFRFTWRASRGQVGGEKGDTCALLCGRSTGRKGKVGRGRWDRVQA